MTFTAWIVAAVLVGLLSPLLVLAAVARAAWSTFQERLGGKSKQRCSERAKA
jgi:hypothetical protein